MAGGNRNHRHTTGNRAPVDAAVINIEIARLSSIMMKAFIVWLDNFIKFVRQSSDLVTRQSILLYA